MTGAGRNKTPEEVAAERQNQEIAEQKRISMTIEMASRMQATEEKDAGYRDIIEVIKAQLMMAQSDFEVLIHTPASEILKKGVDLFMARKVELETRMSTLKWVSSIPSDYKKRADSYLDMRNQKPGTGRNPD